MKTTKQYETEKKVVKGVFFLFLSLFIALLIFYPKVDSPLFDNFNLIEKYNHTTLFFISFIIIIPVMFSGVFYVSWRKFFIFSMLLFVFNFVFNSNYSEDYFFNTLQSSSVIIVLLSFVFSSIYILKRRVFDK